MLDVTGTPSDKFGLRWGQQRGDERLFYAHSDWYDEQGQFLGCGDLSIDDVQRIKGKLEADQMFIVLCGVNYPEPNVVNADLDRLFETSPFIFTQHAQYFVTRLTQNLKNSFDAGLMFTVLTPQQAQQELSSQDRTPRRL
jgi:hypothetical protein